MSHYKRNAANNRDALFGGGGGGRSGGAGANPSAATRPRPSASNRSVPSSLSTSASGATPTVLSSTGGMKSAGAGAAASGFTSTRARLAASSGGGSKVYGSVLSGAAKLEKMKEAEEYRIKAKKAMSRGVFSSPDPIAASMFYKRAADAYRLCGENRLERLHRIASGDCQMGQDAYATAASEYTRAAELSEGSDEPDERKRAECHKLHSDAAEAWRQMGESGRAGESMMKAAMSLLIGTDDGAVPEGDGGWGGGGHGGERLMAMDRKALAAMEVAVETHCPDPLNRYRSFRQTGRSAYDVPAPSSSSSNKSGASNANAASAEDTMELAKQNLIRSPYSHETVFRAVFTLIRYGEYPSALYASGAASRILEDDGFATLSLSRAYATETIIALALGDVVTADRAFMDVHLQRTSYLSSRECKLAEELITSVKRMSVDDLEEARSPSGSNRAALANLDPGLRRLVMRIRTTGRATKGGGGGVGGGGAGRGATAAPLGGGETKTGGASGPTRAPPSAPAAKSVTAASTDEDGELHGEALKQSIESTFAELDNLMGDMGLDSDGEGDDGGGSSGMRRAVDDEDIVNEEVDDDDFVDLR